MSTITLPDFQGLSFAAVAAFNRLRHASDQACVAFAAAGKALRALRRPSRGMRRYVRRQKAAVGA